MNKSGITNLLNKQLRNEPIPINILNECIVEFLEDLNYKISSEQLNQLKETDLLYTHIIRKALDYLIRKHTICSVMFNNKILYYYE